MSIDLTKPAPWRVEDRGDNHYSVVDANGRLVAGLENFFGRERVVADRIVIEHNAFEVMMRRGWGVWYDNFFSAWIIHSPRGDLHGVSAKRFHKPHKTMAAICSTLIEADEWLSNVK